MDSLDNDNGSNPGGDSPSGTLDYTIQFRNGDLTPPPSLDWSLLGELEPSFDGGRVHVIVQFEKIPVRDAQTALRARGLDLQDYLGSSAWFAAVNPEPPDLDGLEAAPRWVGEILPEHRLSPVAMAKSFDEYATDSQGHVGLTVSFFRDVPDGHARIILAGYDADVLAYAETIHNYTVVMPIDAIDALADEDAVRWVDQAPPLLTPVNDDSRARIAADTLWVPPYELDGTGIHVFVFDADVVDSLHPDFGGRVTEGETGGGNAARSHPTHVAGTVGGDGTLSGGTYAGMAPGVTIYSLEVEWTGSGPIFIGDEGDIEDNYDMAINDNDVDIANNSIGSNTAPNGFNCDYEGDYTSTSELIDGIVTGSLGRSIPVIWANGNERGSGRCGIRHFTTAPPATAKNPVLIGATNSNDDSMTAFSSWGPTDDGRLRPDVSAPGCQSDDDFGVTSPSSYFDDTSTPKDYQVKCGTSMATPAVTGVASLMLQQWNAQYVGAPLPSTIKAVLMNSSVDLGNAGPDYQFGYGRVDAPAAVDSIRDGLFREGEVSHGDRAMYRILVPAGEHLRCSLAWDDEPGTPNIVPQLVNDLDMTLTSPLGATIRPWLLDPDNPDAPAVSGADFRNNTEQTDVPVTEAGTYTVAITGTSVPAAPQAFSLACSHEFNADSDGVVVWISHWIDPADMASIRLRDADLTGPTEQVDVTSTSHPTPVSVTLNEVPGESGVYEGSVALGSTLPAIHGDTLTVLYTDASDGLGGVDIVKEDLAQVDGEAPVFAGIHWALPGEGFVELSWSAATDDSPVVYHVYRSTTPGAHDFDSPIGKTEGLSFRDATIEFGIWYYYVVRATDAAGHQETNTEERGARWTDRELIWEEEFATPHAGWVVTNNGGPSTWNMDNPCEREGFYLDEDFYVVDSECAPGEVMNEILTSPSIDCSEYGDVHLYFSIGFQTLDVGGIGDVEVSDRFGVWQKVAEYTTYKSRRFYLDISRWADGNPNVRVRFHYHDAVDAGWWGVDDIDLWASWRCLDGDGDGYGDPGRVICPAGLETDCDDTDPLIHPGSIEICDGLDNNCNGDADEGGNALCLDEYYCNGEEWCDGANGCQPGTFVDCSYLSDECHIGICDEGGDYCISMTKPNGSSCSNGEFCTVNETCTNGSCGGGEARDCDDGLFCTGNEWCNEISDTCVSWGDPCSAGVCCVEDEDACIVPSVAVDQPTAGEDIPSGSELTIAWTTTGSECMRASGVTARFYTSPTTWFDQFLGSTPKPSGSLDWNTPIADWTGLELLVEVAGKTGFDPVQASSGPVDLVMPHSLLITYDYATGEATLTWIGGTTDVLVLEGPYDPDFAGASEVLKAASPWVDKDAGDAEELYYQVRNAMTKAYSPVNLGKRDIAIEQGYNLLAVPLRYDDELMASEVAVDIDKQGGQVSEISKWDSASSVWLTHDPSWPVIDFEIEPGESFLLRAKADSTWSVAGEVIRDREITVDTVYGYTMFGAPTWEFEMASDLADEMIAQGCDPLEISRWRATAGIWQTYDISWPLDDYMIQPIDGYFVKSGLDSPFVYDPMSLEIVRVGDTYQVSFDTDVAGVAVLWIGPSPGSMDSLALDARGNLHEDNDHLFYLDTYTWGKEFYFEIEFLGVVYDDHGAPFHIQP